MIRVTKNLAIINNLLALSAIEAKREPEAVQLLAVSKKQPFSAILEAADAGQRDFGENFVQEGLEKIAASVRPASYAGRSAGQPVANSDDEWVDYEPPKAE